MKAVIFELQDIKSVNAINERNNYKYNPLA